MSLYSDKTIPLSHYGNEKVGELEIHVEFKDQQDVISGIQVPDLSLAPRAPYASKYNAIDAYNPNAKTNRANCFSFYDGDHVPGFDNIDVYPAKFKLPRNME